MDVFTEENKRWPQKKGTFEFSKTDENTIIVQTRGLGEPFPFGEGPDVGYGCELWCECVSEEDAALGLAVLREAAEGLITNQDIVGLVNKWKYIPLDLEQLDVPFPPHFREYQEKRVGVLLGAPVPKHRKEYCTVLNSEGKEIPRIPVKVLTRQYLLRIRARGPEGCKKIVNEVVKNGEYHITKFSS